MDAQKGNGPEAPNSQPAETTTKTFTDFSDAGQGFLFDAPEFCAVPPPRGSAAAEALNDLLAGDVTQLDWLRWGRGWRLAAAVKELGYLGWQPRSIRVVCNGWARPIAQYSLPLKAKQAAAAMRHGGGHA